jgi:hypothetical protein
LGKGAQMTKNIKHLVFAGAVIAMALGTSGCVIRARAPAVTVSAGTTAVATPYYTPMYYNGYVVYYDNGGLPIYYVNGAAYYVPRAYPHYGRLVGHYRTYRPHYQRWYSSHGVRYRAYRNPHYRGPVYRPARPPRAVVVRPGARVHHRGRVRVRGGPPPRRAAPPPPRRTYRRGAPPPRRGGPPPRRGGAPPPPTVVR